MSHVHANPDVPVITIDGPSGSGKGTIAHLLADKLGFNLLDSGSLYRLTALSATQKQVDMENSLHCEELAKHLDVTFSVRKDGIKIILAGEDVSGKIRTEVVGKGASIVAAHPNVRAALLERQRAFAELPGLVADGRDMGTVVFPGAQVKIFLTASSDIRADRRCAQLSSAGETVNRDEILADVRSRDARDANRNVAPLKPADNATVIDSTHLTVEQVLSEVYDIVYVALGE